MTATVQATSPLTHDQAVSYIEQRAAQLNLDPQAVLAVAAQEGIGGGVGDSGTSFGPWQLHVGGAFPSQVGGVSTSDWSAQQKQDWAWSPAGIDYALTRIQSVAQGLSGAAAIQNIVTLFERPANPNAEIQGALNAYGSTSTAGVGGGTAGLAGLGGTAQDVGFNWFWPLPPSTGSSIVGSLEAPFKTLGNIIAAPFESIYEAGVRFAGKVGGWLFRLLLIAGGGVLVVQGFRMVADSR